MARAILRTFKTSVVPINHEMHSRAHTISYIAIIAGQTLFLPNKQVAYTFDAGPNAVLFVREEDVAEIASLVKHFFGQTSDNE